MTERRNATLLVRMRIQQELTSPRVLVGYAFGLWLGLSISIRYVGFAAGNPVEILEPFLLLTNNYLSVTLVLIGYFIVIADAPFVDSLTLYTLIRSGGKAWRHSMVCYLMLQFLIYVGIILLGCMIPCIFQGNLTNEWSDTMQILIQVTPTIAVMDYNLPVFYEGVLTAWGMYGAVLHSFLLLGCYCFFLGLIAFIGNLNVNFPLGSFLAVGIHFVGILLLSDFVPVFWPSLVAHTILQYHVPGTDVLTLAESYGVFLILDLVSLFILRRLAVYTDYHVSISEKIW